MAINATRAHKPLLRFESFADASAQPVDRPGLSGIPQTMVIVQDMADYGRRMVASTDNMLEISEYVVKLAVDRIKYTNQMIESNEKMIKSGLQRTRSRAKTTEIGECPGASSR